VDHARRLGDRVRDRRRAPRAGAAATPLDRIIDIAEFRAGLRAFLRHSEHACRTFDLTPQRFQLLLAIKGATDGSGQSSVTTLADRLQASRNSVTELCSRAEEAGLVQRASSAEDGRLVLLSVTAEGERRLLGVLGATDAYRDELLTAFEALAGTLRTAVR
jgi:DNA-binding MarR family transcriptional regulator